MKHPSLQAAAPFRWLLVLCLAFISACGEAPGEPTHSVVSHVETPAEPVAGYFSTGCRGAFPLRDELRLLARSPRRAVVIALSITPLHERATWSMTYGERTRLNETEVWQFSSMRVLTDTNTRDLARVAAQTLDVHVIIPETSREIDRTGGVWLPIPGSRFAPPIITSAGPAPGPLFVIEYVGGRWLLVGQFSFSEERISRDHESVAVGDLVEEVNALRSTGR